MALRRPAPGLDKYPGPRSTPTVDGNRLYAITTESHLVCLDTASGKDHWRRSLAADFGGSLMKAMGTHSWKFSESPLVDGDRVIVIPGAQDAEQGMLFSYDVTVK